MSIYTSDNAECYVFYTMLNNDVKLNNDEDLSLNESVLLTIPDDCRPTKIIFNPPATIMYCKDGSKTVVKCDKSDTYSKEMGALLCFMKKYFGNKAVNKFLKDFVWDD